MSQRQRLANCCVPNLQVRGRREVGGGVICEVCVCVCVLVCSCVCVYFHVKCTVSVSVRLSVVQCLNNY